MRGTRVRLVLALGGLVAALAPVAHAMNVAVDPATGRVAVLETDAGADLPPRIYDLAGRAQAAPQAFNTSGNTTLYVTLPLPPGVYRVVSNTTETVLAVVQPRPPPAGDDGRTVRALNNLTQVVYALERSVAVALANESEAHQAILTGIGSVVRNASLAAADVRAARAAAEAIRMPSDLPRRSDVENGVRTATARMGHELATQRLLTLTALTLAAANLVTTAAAFFVQRHRAKPQTPAGPGVADARRSPMGEALTGQGPAGFDAVRRSSLATPTAAGSTAPSPGPAAPSPHPGECEVA